MRRLHNITAGLLLAVLTALPGNESVDAADIGILTGTVRVVSEPPYAIRINAYPGVAHTTAPSNDTEGKSLIREIVVYLEKVAAPHAIDPPASPKLTQRGMEFEPSVLVILAGQEVGFPNEDPYYHNVFSYSPAKRFDLGRYARGKSKSVVFEDPGVVQVFCDIHSDMKGTILVLQNPYFARPDTETGAFRIPSVPAGRYRLVVWHPDLETVSREIEVRPGAATPIEVEI
ncbi:MAG: hypothetical protein HKN20_16340 [Gemmatimonadetes bacterium]|nr:hypothetical protein [Gemmatimonadota bacterium]